MGIKYLKKANKTPSTDDNKTRETVQNILVTRFSNTIFNSLWNNKHISHIEITAAESIGIENRGEYYDKAGAIRDMFQNHLLELLCLISMEIPKSNTSDMIRDEKLKVLKKIKKINTKTDIIRGQYIKSEINGRKLLLESDFKFSYEKED